MRYADAPADDEADDNTAPVRVPQPRGPEPAGSTERSDNGPEPAASALTDAPESGLSPDGSAPAPGAVPATRLTDREREILAFERRWWKHAGAKEQAIRDSFDISATRYYQILNGLLDNPDALAVEPVLVARLRRLRATRSRSRRR
ncbi:DUF3263 domain-containing protein [Plantactinospora sp. B24E8]